MQTPDHWAERDLLRARILWEDATPQRIVDVKWVYIEVVQLFGLWWNLTSRKRELLYVAQLVNGSDGDLGASLMHVARITGRVRAVLLAAGRAGPTEKGSDEELFEQLERTVLTVALVRQQMGLLGKEQNPALALVEKYLLGLPRTAEIDLIFSDPLLELSLDKRAQRVFREHVQRQAAEQMRAERSQATEKAQEKTGAPDYEI